MKNLVVRALAGAIFVVIIVSGIYIHPYVFLSVFSLVIALTLWEFSGLLIQYKNALPERLIDISGGVYLFFSTFVYVNELSGKEIFLPYLFFLMYIFIAEFYRKDSNPINNWAYTLLGQIYCAGSFSLLNCIIFTPAVSGGVVFTPLFAFVLFAFVWLNDTSAYLVGSTMGKRRLFERISPKKSWEGFWGGLIVVLLSSQLFAYYIPDLSWYNWLGLSATVVLFATWGDLVESLLKRTLTIKDSGHLIPGHGGMLDRLDSVLMAIPATYIYIELFIRN
ncbi:MAG: phosphatidate cytidylyltransferase [Tannerellaceae bacterium]|nr:phosphatidate cytidylyltransferase [Tannerellaceae bacterium]